MSNDIVKAISRAPLNPLNLLHLYEFYAKMLIPMRIFALETNTEHFKKKFLSEEEQEVLTIYYHWFAFALAIMKQGVFTLVIISIGAGLITVGLLWLWVTLAMLLLWTIVIFPSMVKAFLDWRYDFTFVTSDKVIVADQSSLFRQKITPINLENFASVSTETQYANMFPFGKLRFHLKSGLGEDLILRYIPNADEVAAKIANAVTIFQRRKDLRRFGGESQQAL